MTLIKFKYLRKKYLKLLKLLKVKNFNSSLIYASEYNKIGCKYIIIKNYFMAYICFKKCVEYCPYASIYWSNIGYAIRFFKNYERREDIQRIATQSLDKSIEIEPTNIISLHNRSFLELIINNYESALFYCNKALEINNFNFKTYYNRGVIYIHYKKYDLAIQDLIKSINFYKLYFNSYKKLIKAILLKAQTALNKAVKVRRPLGG